MTIQRREAVLPIRSPWLDTQQNEPLGKLRKAHPLAELGDRQTEGGGELEEGSLFGSAEFFFAASTAPEVNPLTFKTS